MAGTIPFPARELDLQDVADECARRVLQLEAGPVREVAREAARKAPIRLHLDTVAVPTGDAVDALKLEARVLDALRAELGEEDFRKAQSDAMRAISDGLNRATGEIVNEAIEERVRELSEPDGVPIVKPLITDV